MISLQYFILLFKVVCLLFVGSDADCIEFIAEKRQREGIMAKRSPITAAGCVETCEDLNTCFAVNYFRLNATCQLLNRTMPESKLIKMTKCFYKAVRRPSQESIDNDPCFKLICPWDEICMHNTTTNLAECYPFCKNPPTIPGTLKETVEIEVGQNYTYRCRDGLFGKGDQISSVTCLRDGHWTGANFTCVCSTPPTKYVTINEMAEHEIGQNYRYKCQSGQFQKGDLNPTITCLEYGGWTSTNFQCVKQNWKQDTIYYNSTHTSVLISNVTGIDLLKCMRQCDDIQTNCLSFFYDNQTSQCLLSSSFRRGLPQYLQSSEGLVYYTAPSNSCDVEYMNVSLGFSFFCIKKSSYLTNFNEAMQRCENEKTKLLVITTKAQIADLKRYVPNFAMFRLEQGDMNAAKLTAMQRIHLEPFPMATLVLKSFPSFVPLDNSQGMNVTQNYGWVGISDQTKEGTWVSWDGKSVYPFWDPGEPNGQTIENCGMFATDRIGLLDYSCIANLYIVCSKT